MNIKKLIVTTYFSYILVCIGCLISGGMNAQSNYAMSLPGGLDGNVSNVAIPALNIASLPITIEMWYKPDATQNYYATLWYTRGATNNSGFQYDRWSGSPQGMTNLKGMWNGTAQIPSTQPIPGKWNHIAMVVTSASKKFYINGVEFTETGTSFNNFPFDGITYIGWDKPNTTLKDRTLKGLIDEFRVWNVARTAQEIEDKKLATLTGTETGLIGYWNFDDQNPTHASDLTGHGFHGTINGGSYVTSGVFDPMIFDKSGVSQKSQEVNSPSLNATVACLQIVTVNSLNPLRLTKLYLNATGTTSLANISNVKIYYTGSDSIFNGSANIASLATSPSAALFSVDCSQKLTEGSNYFWIAYDIDKGVNKGNMMDAGCDSFILTGSVAKTYIPDNATPSGQLMVNPDMFMTHVKLPVNVVSTLGETPLAGANFVSFQQNAITTYKGYQYVTYWDHTYRVCIARRKLPLGLWQIIEFPDYTVTAARIADGHYNISIGICPNDGTIHVAFDHHSDVLHYRKSMVGLANKPEELTWSASSFGAIQDYMVSGQQMTLVTYPRFVTKPNGNLLYEYRYGTSGAGDSYLCEYSATIGTWAQIGKYIDGLAVNNNAYLNGIYYDQNSRLHASWVWRETPDPLTNHDVCYMYSDDDGRTWKAYNGSQVGTVITSAVNSNTSGIKIWSIAQNRGLINQESEAVDSKGGVHILQSYLPDSDPNSTNFWNDRARAYLHHIYRDENGMWKNDVIDAVSVNRSKIAVDEGDNLYIVAPNYRIYYASASEKWKKWTVMDISESNSAINEGLIDREMLLDESVLSFVFAQTGGKILVPYYLIDKSKPGKGTGLNTSVYGGSNFGSLLNQKLGTVNVTSGDINYAGDSVSIRCAGTLETKYAEAYTLQFTTSGSATVWINDIQVLNTGPISATSTFPVVLDLQPSHKYNVKIEGKYATNNVVTKLEWQSDRQSREFVPLTALYGKLILSSVATLSDLTVNGSTIAGFAAGTVTYNVMLPIGSSVPAVSGTATDSKANVLVTPASGLVGTTTILVTAEDGTTKLTYAVNFTVSTGVHTINGLAINVYPTITSGSFTVETAGKLANITVFDIYGKEVLKQIATSSIQKIYIATAGIYFVRVECNGVTNLIKVIKTN